MDTHNSSIILIPHFNDPEGLYVSLSSIDSSEQIDCVVVDDGSQVLFSEEQAKTAFRVNGTLSFIYLEENRGITVALNTGLKFILEKGYQFIARLDCNDIVLGKRFKIQEDFLKFNPSISLIGTFTTFVDTKGKKLFNLSLPTSHKKIEKKIYVQATFIHPSIMFTSKIIEENGLYPDEYTAAEDYALFFKTIKKYQTANIPDFLMQCEINPKGISGLKRREQIQSKIRLIQHHFYWEFWPIYGLIRSSVAFYIPRNTLNFLKKFISP